MPALYMTFYIFAVFVFGYHFQLEAIDNIREKEVTTSSYSMAERMVYLMSHLAKEAKALPSANNKKLALSDISSLPSWFTIGSEPISLVIHGGVAFVYCSKDCPPDLMGNLIKITHGSPFVGKVVAGKIQSPILSTMNRPVPASIPNSSVVYSQ